VILLAAIDDYMSALVGNVAVVIVEVRRLEARGKIVHGGCGGEVDRHAC
jgi:hypothetical protein